LTPPRATIIPLPGQVTKIRITPPRLKSWTPGAHVFLSIPSLGLGQSHPATIASVPSSHNGDLIFLLRSYRGFTSRLHRAATANESQTFLTLIDGPYGGTHSDFAAFDTAVLIAGSTGVTFTLSLLLDLAHRAAADAGKRLPLRRVVFVWAIRTVSCTSWIADELRTAYQKLHGAGIEMEVQIFVTCDPTFTQQSAGADEGNNGACRCDIDVGGPCCCQAGAHAGKEEEIDFVKSEDTENKMLAEKVKEEVARPVGLDFASFHSGRPDFTPLMWEVLNRAKGETGVAVCGPLGMTSRVRTVVATVSDQRGVHKGTGAEGVYLHSECFGW
jgi:ferric-chelate reductase